MGTQESPQMQLHQIREARAAKVAEARSLLASTPQLNAEGQAKFDSIKIEIQNPEADEQRAQFIEDAERRSLGAPGQGPQRAGRPRIAAGGHSLPAPQRNGCSCRVFA